MFWLNAWPCSKYRAPFRPRGSGEHSPNKVWDRPSPDTFLQFPVAGWPAEEIKIGAVSHFCC